LDFLHIDDRECTVKQALRLKNAFIQGRVKDEGITPTLKFENNYQLVKRAMDIFKRHQRSS
jgi:hypothetical protein